MFLYSFPVASMDYEPLSTLLIFDTCDTRHCTNITIKNDAVLENTESFFVKLLRTPDLDSRITLDPVLAEIEITDNDGLCNMPYTQKSFKTVLS